MKAAPGSSLRGGCPQAHQLPAKWPGPMQPQLKASRGTRAARGGRLQPRRQTRSPKSGPQQDGSKGAAAKPSARAFPNRERLA